MGVAVYVPADLATWEPWFAWQPIQAGVVRSAHSKAVRIYGPLPSTLPIWLRYVERQKLGDRWCYRVLARRETDDEWESRQW